MSPGLHPSARVLGHPGSLHHHLDPPDRQDRDRDQGPLGLHRQHAAGPVSDGRCEFIGIDVRYSVCKELSEEFKRPEYAPPPLFKRMVAAGRHGRKTGRGFYEYERKPTPVAA
jgi:3-hydroxybutyryl-CoA dehydrogenase